MSIDSDAATRPASGVQSVGRALDLLEILADAGGQLGIGEMASRTDIPLPTIHRLLQTLVDRGYVRRLASRRYALGFRLVPLGQSAGSLLGADAQVVLGGLVDALGESANLAALSGDHAEYVAQVPSRHSMRMFTEVGRRVELHCTGVGKALLAGLDDEQVAGIVRRVGTPAYTEHTVTTADDLRAALDVVRRQGYAIDEQEQELGVRCVAVAVPLGSPATLAVSVSGPSPRMSDEVVARAVPLLQDAARRLATGLAGTV